MAYDFTTVTERRGTNCIKYDAAMRRMGRDDLLPLWVADMDLALPEEVLASIHEAVAHGIFGYTFASDDLLAAVCGWFKRRHNWEVDPHWIVQTPGVVFAIGAALQAYTKPGDAILIQEPVYYPFAQLIRANERKLINNELIFNEGRYSIDFEDFEKKIIKNDVKLFILCSPHNPIGRVWTCEELTRMGEICLKYGVLVIADEIHADFTYPGHIHRVFETLSPEFAEQTITCSAPSKTFNLAGLQAANVIISNPTLRQKYQNVFTQFGYNAPGALALVAMQSVYERGEAWLDALKQHLQDNLNFFEEYLNTYIPEVKIVKPEGTYLVWVDFSGLGLDDETLEDFIIDKSHLWLDGGWMFSTQGRSGQFQRFNIACPRTTLEQALNQIKAAYDAREAK